MMCTKSEICDKNDKICVFYIDTDNEKIAIQDDSDLQMAYALALTSDKKVKFLIETSNSCSTKAVSPLIFSLPLSMQ